MSYALRIGSLSDGLTTFDATAAGVNVKDGSADGPRVITHIVENDAGALIDLDGTGIAVLVPPLVTYNLIFDAANPAAQTQYQNLVKLKGHHVTFVGRLPGAGGVSTFSAPGRVMDVRGMWEPPFKVGTASRIPIAVDIQLKDFID